MSTMTDAIPLPVFGEGTPARNGRNLAVVAAVSITPMAVARRDASDYAVSTHIRFVAPFDAEFPSLAIEGDAYVHLHDGRLQVMLSAVWVNSRQNAFLNESDSLVIATVMNLEEMLKEFKATITVQNSTDGGGHIVIDFPF